VVVEEIFYPETGEIEAPLKAEHVSLIPKSAAALRRLKEAGYLLVLISNQAGFAKGKTSLRALTLAHERFVALLADEGVRLDDVYYSYGHPEGVVPHFSGPSLDRKPGPYNVLIAAARNDIDLESSWFVGDRHTDVECALAVGVKPLWIGNSNAAEGSSTPAIRVSDLASAVTVILGPKDLK
jgi:D-glycero-D-manno-heptose 1,7-bisphosphate phosphatase